MESTIFMDADGTLFFGPRRHGVKIIKEDIGQQKLVTCPEVGETEVLEVTTARYATYISIKTIGLLKGLKEDGGRLVLITAGTQQGALRKAQLLPLDHVVCENGGIIYDNKMQEDRAWTDYISIGVENLRTQYQHLLATMPRGVTAEMREASIHVRNILLSRDEFTDWGSGMQLTDGLEKVFNYGHFIVHSSRSGKKNAACYLTGGNNRSTHHIGDDENDLELFEWVEQAHVLGHANTRVLEVAKRRGYKISTRRYFDGINEILIGLNP